MGGGAIGGITAAKLAADVVVLDANAEHAAAMREPGLVINDGPPVPLDVVESVDALDGAFDFALIAVKAPLHHVVLEPLVARGGIDTFVSMGNGLIQDRMEGIVGAGNLLACIVEWGGSNVGPGQLVRDSEGGYMLGELDGVSRSRAGELAAALEPVGPVRITDNVRGMIWSKLLINSTFTGLSAVSGLRYGGVAEQGRDAVFALWAEGVAVGDAQGLQLERVHVDPHRFDDAALADYMACSGNVRPSMLQDLDAGRETEVDVVNGGVASRGTRARHPDPVQRPRGRAGALDGTGRALPGPALVGLRERGADDQRHRQLNPGGRPRRGVQVVLEAVLAELARDQHVEDHEAGGLDGDADDPEHDRVVEAVPAGAGEVDREVQDEPERDQGGRGDQAGSLVALHHELAELPGGQQVEHDEAGDKYREPDAAVREHLQD